MRAWNTVFRVQIGLGLIVAVPGGGRRQHTRLGQGPRIAAIRLHFAAALSVHRREVGISDDHVVPQPLPGTAPPTRSPWRIRSGSAPAADAVVPVMASE